MHQSMYSVALFVFGCCACSSSGSSNGSSSLPKQDAVWMHFGAGDYELKLTSFSGACALEQANVSHEQSSTYAAFHFSLPAGDDSVPAGTYPVASSGTIVDMELKTLDSQCNTQSSISATSGTLTLSDPLTTGDAHGSYSLVMASGEHVSGSFVAAACDTPTTTVASACVTRSSSSSTGGDNMAGAASIAGMSSSSGGSSSGGSSSGGSSSGGAAANCAGVNSTDCTTCLSGTCMTTSAQCFADTSCTAALTALLSCCSSGSSTDQCESAFNTAGGSLAMAVTTCYQLNCVEKCSGTPSGASNGGAPGSGGSGPAVQGSWADAATCSTGAQNTYECCLLSGGSCSTLAQYTSCCETKSCAAGGILACMANHHATDPTSCSSALTTCGD